MCWEARSFDSLSAHTNIGDYVHFCVSKHVKWVSHPAFYCIWRRCGTAPSFNSVKCLRLLPCLAFLCQLCPKWMSFLQHNKLFCSPFSHLLWTIFSPELSAHEPRAWCLRDLIFIITLVLSLSHSPHPATHVYVQKGTIPWDPSLSLPEETVEVHLGVAVRIYFLYRKHGVLTEPSRMCIVDDGRESLVKTNFRFFVDLANTRIACTSLLKMQCVKCGCMNTPIFKYIQGCPKTFLRWEKPVDNLPLQMTKCLVIKK